jgi:hypothetical protein
MFGINAKVIVVIPNTLVNDPTADLLHARHPTAHGPRPNFYMGKFLMNDNISPSLFVVISELLLAT